MGIIIVELNAAFDPYPSFKSHQLLYEPQLGANNISARLSGSTEMLVIAGPSGKIFDTEDHQIPSSMNISTSSNISMMVIYQIY